MWKTSLVNAARQAAEVIDISAYENAFDIVNKSVSIRAQMRSDAIVGRRAAGDWCVGST
jgi:hypothetical protein